jgi:hypothetical protein
MTIVGPRTFLLIAMLMMISPGAVHAQSKAGEVLAIKGDCFATTAGQRHLLKLGDAVAVGDEVEVPDGGKLKLRMIDGSVIAAASASRLTIRSYDADPQHRDVVLALTTGLLRAVVAPVSQPSRFEVDGATGVAAVRSTDWFVEVQKGTMQVGVVEGRVALISAATKGTVNIPARWGARLEAGRDPVTPRVWSREEFDAVIARTDLN